MRAAAAQPPSAAPVKTEPDKPKVQDIEIPNRRRDWSYLPGHREREFLSQKLLMQQKMLQDVALQVIQSGWDLDVHAVELEGLKEKREFAERMFERASQGLTQDEAVDQNPPAHLKPSRAGSAGPSKTASGSAPVDDLIDKIVRYTRSKSPIQYIHGDDRFPNVYRGSTDKAWTKLGFRAAVSVEEGVLRLVKLYLQRTERVLQKKIDAECGASAQNLQDNADLHKLNNCQAHVDMDVQGELTILGSPDDVNDNRWHAGTTLPPYPVRTFVKYDANGRPLLAVKEKDQDYFFGIRHSPTPREGTVKVERIWRNDIAAGDYVDWEMEVNAEEGTMKLILPGFPLQLKPPASPGGNFYLVPSELEIWPFRVTPICCPAPPPWPFFRDDPVSFQMEFQRTSLVRPFLASPIKTLCDRFSRARRKVQRDLATLTLETLNEPRRKESSLAPKWVNANLPACSNSCEHPTICVDTGDCQCVLSSCPALQRFPFSAYANLPVLSYPPIQVNSNTPDDDPNFNPLIDMVARSSWLNVLRPQASRFVGTKTPFPKVHVGELHQEDADWRKTTTEGKTLHLLRDAHCFSADTSMEHA
ncbi:hypothetical protein FRC00_004598, partial [Tulasnella sp. 408]